MLQHVDVGSAARFTPERLEEARSIGTEKLRDIGSAPIRDEASEPSKGGLAVRQEYELVPGVEANELRHPRRLEELPEPGEREEPDEEVVPDSQIEQASFVFYCKIGMSLPNLRGEQA